VDPLLIVGLVVAMLSIVVSTVMDGNGFGPLIGPSSAVLVMVGSVGATMMSTRKKDLGAVPAGLVVALKGNAPDTDKAVTTLASIAEVVRREGMLAMEGKLADIDDDFLRRGLQLLVDGQDADQIAEVLQIDIAALDERHQTVIGFYKGLGGYAPTFGMMGTVIGLVNMLGNLSDPEQLGIGMSLALLTTLYGVAFANLVFLPIATRLEKLNEVEMAARDMAIDGILSVQAGLSPRLLVERLETYLPPKQRVGHAERVNGPTAVPTEAKEAA
jgi:chemotaxis protein MotA